MISNYVEYDEYDEDDDDDPPEVIEELSPRHIGEQEVQVLSVNTRPQELYQERMLDLLQFHRQLLLFSVIEYTCSIFFSFLTCSTCFIFSISSIDITFRAKYLSVP